MLRASSTLLAAALLAACASSPRTVVELNETAAKEMVLPLDGVLDGLLVLDTAFGDVKVFAREAGAPKARCRLVASGRTREEAATVLQRFAAVVERQQEGLRVCMRGEPLTPEGSNLRLAPRMEIEATVPPGQRLRVVSRSGSVHVEGPVSACTLETGFGDLTIEGARAGRVRAETRSGTITLRDVRVPEAELKTDFGDIVVERAQGPLAAQTSSGDISVRAFRDGACSLRSNFGDLRAEGILTEVDAETSSGDVRIRAAAGSAMTGPWTLATRFGDVELGLPRGFACDLAARTSFGTIHSEFGVRTRGEADSNSLSGSIGAGGPLLTAVTASGDVRLRVVER